jgi:hypothetical protein
MKVSSINRSLDEVAQEVSDVTAKADWIAVAYCVGDEVTTVLARRRGGDEKTLIIGGLQRVVHMLCEK